MPATPSRRHTSRQESSPSVMNITPTRQTRATASNNIPITPPRPSISTRSSKSTTLNQDPSSDLTSPKRSTSTKMTETRSRGRPPKKQNSLKLEHEDQPSNDVGTGDVVEMDIEEPITRSSRMTRRSGSNSVVSVTPNRNKKQVKTRNTFNSREAALPFIIPERIERQLSSTSTSISEIGNNGTNTSSHDIPHPPDLTITAPTPSTVDNNSSEVGNVSLSPLHTGRSTRSKSMISDPHSLSPPPKALTPGTSKRGRKKIENSGNEDIISHEKTSSPASSPQILPESVISPPISKLDSTTPSTRLAPSLSSSSHKGQHKATYSPERLSSLRKSSLLHTDLQSNTQFSQFSSSSSLSNHLLRRRSIHELSHSTPSSRIKGRRRGSLQEGTSSSENEDRESEIIHEEENILSTKSNPMNHLNRSSEHDTMIHPPHHHHPFREHLIRSVHSSSTSSSSSLVSLPTSSPFSSTLNDHSIKNRRQKPVDIRHIHHQNNSHLNDDDNTTLTGTSSPQRRGRRSHLKYDDSMEHDMTTDATSTNGECTNIRKNGEEDEEMEDIEHDHHDNHEEEEDDDGDDEDGDDEQEERKRREGRGKDKDETNSENYIQTSRKMTRRTSSRISPTTLLSPPIPSTSSTSIVPSSSKRSMTHSPTKTSHLKSKNKRMSTPPPPLIQPESDIGSSSMDGEHDESMDDPFNRQDNNKNDNNNNDNDNDNSKKKKNNTNPLLTRIRSILQSSIGDSDPSSDSEIPDEEGDEDNEEEDDDDDDDDEVGDGEDDEEGEHGGNERSGTGIDTNTDEDVIPMSGTVTPGNTRRRSSLLLDTDLLQKSLTQESKDGEEDEDDEEDEEGDGEGGENEEDEEDEEDEGLIKGIKKEEGVETVGKKRVGKPITSQLRRSRRRRKRTRKNLADRGDDGDDEGGEVTMDETEEDEDEEDEEDEEERVRVREHEIEDDEDELDDLGKYIHFIFFFFF